MINVNLKDDLMSKDCSLRKSEQEMDSLTFRNTQLEKRVGVLQDELQAANNVKTYITISPDAIIVPDVINVKFIIP